MVWSRPPGSGGSRRSGTSDINFQPQTTLRERPREEYFYRRGNRVSPCWSAHVAEGGACAPGLVLKVPALRSEKVPSKACDFKTYRFQRSTGPDRLLRSGTRQLGSETPHRAAWSFTPTVCARVPASVCVRVCACASVHVHVCVLAPRSRATQPGTNASPLPTGHVPQAPPAGGRLISDRGRQRGLSSNVKRPVWSRGKGSSGAKGPRRRWGLLCPMARQERVKQIRGARGAPTSVRQRWSPIPDGGRWELRTAPCKAVDRQPSPASPALPTVEPSALELPAAALGCRHHRPGYTQGNLFLIRD